MNVISQSHTRVAAAAGGVALGALAIPTASAQGEIVPPSIYNTFDVDTLYLLTIDEAGPIGALEAGDHIWFGVEYNDAHTDVAPDSWAFQSNDIFAGNGSGAIVVDNGLTQSTSFIIEGNITGLQGLPFTDSVDTYVTGGFLADYGNIHFLSVELSGPRGTFSVPPGEDLSLWHMFNEETLFSYPNASFSGNFGGQDFSGETTAIFLPAPGAGILLALSGLTAGRRRRPDNESTTTAHLMYPAP